MAETNNALSHQAILQNIKHIKNIGELDDEAEDYYKNPAFEENVFQYIQRDIKKKFPETPLSVWDSFERAYHGDELDKVSPQLKPKQSASVKSAFTVFDSDEPVNTNIPANHQVVETNAILEEGKEEEDYESDELTSGDDTDED